LDKAGTKMTENNLIRIAHQNSIKERKGGDSPSPSTEQILFALVNIFEDHQAVLCESFLSTDGEIALTQL
jgi:hypothetical protein